VVQPATLGIFVIFRGRFLFWDLLGASPLPAPIGSSHQPGRGLGKGSEKRREKERASLRGSQKVKGPDACFG
jgi:hypothetical protein